MDRLATGDRDPIKMRPTPQPQKDVMESQRWRRPHDRNCCLSAHTLVTPN
jgi:hypothetical protein